MKNLISQNIKTIVVFFVMLFGIPLFVDWVILGNEFPSHLTNGEWAGFLGSFLGGIATLISVCLTIRYNERTKETENREEKRVYLELMVHINTTIKQLQDHEPDKGKQIYLFKNMEYVDDASHCTILQIINRSKYQGNNIRVTLHTTDQSEAEHKYESSIPYIASQELTYIVLPKATYSISGGRVTSELMNPGSEKPDEEIKTIEINYKTEAGESIFLKVTELTNYSYSVEGKEVFQYSYDTIGKYLRPRNKRRS